MVASVQTNSLVPQVIKRIGVVEFTKEDTKAIDDPHNDALVISLLIGEFRN